MAGLRCLCQPRIILSMWTSSWCHFGFLGPVERKGPLDWNTNWFFCASSSALYHNKLYRLGKTGLSSSFNIFKPSILVFFSSSHFPMASATIYGELPLKWVVFTGSS